MRHLPSTPREVIRRLRPGVIVGCRVWPVWHLGIVSDELGPDGLPRVLSRSRRAGVAADEPWSVFAGSREVAIVGYPSRLPASRVLARARAELGSRWTPLRNCEHFAFSAHGAPHSPTAEKIASLSVGLLRGALWFA